METDPCPDCGAPLALGGRFCKKCGWDADLVDSEDAYLDGVDLPEGGDFTDADYQHFLEREGLVERPAAARRPARPDRSSVVLIVLVVLALLVAMLL